MSQAPGDIHSLPHEVSEDTDDGINLKKIILVGIISLVVFMLSAVVAWWMLVDDTAEFAKRGVAATPVGLNKLQEVGLVDLVHFDDDQRLERWKQAKAKAATSYGWVDRAKGIVHIPIEEAMKEVVRQAQAGAPAPGGAPR
jgi:hypothetical protein